MTDLGDAASAWGSTASAWEGAASEIDRAKATATDALLRGLAVQPGERVLELAAGPGSLGPVWSELVGPTGSVVLSDVAPEMVAAARRRSGGLANLDLEVLDVSAIARADASSDVVACRMGLMFAPDPSTALAEIHRVLAPGGRLGAVTWAGLEHNPWMTCVGMAAMVAGIVVGGPPVEPGGVFSLGDPDQVDALLSAAGFTDVSVEPADVLFHADDVASHIDRVSALAGPLALAIRDATPEQREAFHRTATELVAPFSSASGVELPGRSLVVIAHHPG